MFKDIVPVILSGGSGSRLWPLSRAKYPKQFLPLIGTKSLFVQTAQRVGAAFGFAAPIVIASDDHRFIIREQAEKAAIGLGAIILEPAGRNTAPAIAVAALKAAQSNPKALLLFLAADHLILDVPEFHAAIKTAKAAAEAGHLVCFGMTPTRAETGYGYIKRGAGLDGVDGAFKVDGFREKPDVTTAEAYVADGGYSWNSGMFMFRADVILGEFARLQPAMLKGAEAALADAEDDIGFLRLGAKAFAAIKGDSIDYAIMEKTDKAAVVPAEFGWSDVGSFSALWQSGDHDKKGNVLRGDVVVEDTEGCYIHADDRLVTALGVRDLVIVTTDDAVMVADKSRDQDVKLLVDRLKASKREEINFHSVVYRPWGNYRTLAIGDRYQVKEIEVYPGKRLSLQKHHHRAEHWVVVQGSAIVTRDQETHLLSENQSIYLPLGAVHRLDNPGKISLRLIEVQSGSYLGEDDIVRIEDDFNRN